MQSFSELDISQYVRDQLTSSDFVTPTPVQAAAIPRALAGKDILATAQTGTGKTLAFLIPIMERLVQENARGIAALVLGPTRELAIQVADQYEALRGKRLPPAAVVVGGLSEGRQIQSLRGGARLAIATPGRLEDFLERGLIDFRPLRILVLDEADRMLDMGFLPSIRRIVSAIPRQRQTMCFSATLEASVAHLVSDYLREPERIALGSITKPSENVRVQAFEAPYGGKPEVLRRLLTREPGRCLVFARTKRGAERLAWSLTRDGFDAAIIHGGRSQSQRLAALDGFRSGRYRILVATDVAARGIHVEGVAHVINYDLPELAENFIHRAGRTGRAGERGIASALFFREETPQLVHLERSLGIRIERMPLPGEAPLPRKDVRERAAAKNSPPHEQHRSTVMALPGEFLQVQMSNESPVKRWHSSR